MIFPDDVQQLRGVTQVRANLERYGQGPVPIGRWSEDQILSGQRANGVWGQISAPARASGLLESRRTRLTDKARAFVRDNYLSRLDSHRPRLVESWIRLKGRAFLIADLDPIPSLPEQIDTIMRLNRNLELIVVGIDDEGWVVGTADLPAEAAVDQVTAIAERLAMLCAWWEAAFTGTDELHKTTSS